MRVVFGLVLIAGLALAGGAVYMAKNYIGGYQAALAKERKAREHMVKTVPVFVATRTLEYGDLISREDVRSVNWPDNAIPEGVFTDEAALFAGGDDELRMVARAMEKDEAILAVKVTEPGEAAGITTRLEKGMRAFALRVDVASGVSGFLRPGDRVDVYWTGKVGTGGPGDRVQSDMTRLIESSVELIAVDQKAGGDLDTAVIARTVTVAASPKQVANFAQAQSTGRLSLSLVGRGEDDVIAEAIEVDQNRLLGIKEEQKVEIKQEVERTCSIRTRRGAEVVEIPIPCSD